ncbi:2-methylcitrate dehydratase PrpD [Aspergillus eucalypticola CBS 122712]|uniref:2-methylcitrate dehydratase PrpD n=1 Tax=Aspergillus eucalypticola (strain CBS 122712 / IBT 29274) TaxID=1448314 RepID=A0A317VSK5_ASPEC|nr:2-methylcitrate dehydratase PrpD [Aspergillus eucalypticola CBS 122712]PWY76549.1 2-methylcitrate dehydratase PrpD [Aspergillus eucalypticola CBS 122712]
MNEPKPPQEPIYDLPLRDITTYTHSPTNTTHHTAARTALLDALSCAIETASKSPSARALLGSIIPGTTVPHGFPVPGTSHTVDPVKGTFDLGVLIRYLDHNDASWGMEWGHPSGRYFPLPLIQTHYQALNAFHAHNLDHVILVELASAAVCSWMMGHSATKTQSILSHVWMDAGPSHLYRTHPCTVPRKGWAAADAAARAVELVFRADRADDGGSGAAMRGVGSVLNHEGGGFRDGRFGGREFEFIGELGAMEARGVEGVMYKIMPVEGHGCAAVEAVLGQMKKEPRVMWDEVEEVLVRVPWAAKYIISRPGREELKCAAERDHCLEWVVAVAMVKGRAIEVEDYGDEGGWVGDKMVEELRGRIVVREDEELTRDYLDVGKRSIAAGVVFRLKDGRVLEEVLVEFPVGHVRNPRTGEEVRGKFVRNLRLMFTEEEIQSILEVVERDDARVCELVDLLARSETHL